MVHGRQGPGDHRQGDGRLPRPVRRATLLALLPGLLVGWALRGFPAPPHDSGGILLSLLVWLPGALLVGLVAALVALVRDTLGKLPGNGYGMVRGHTDNPDGPLPLTDWLTERLDATAGLGPDGPPLTYGDLYGPEASTAFTSLGLDDETRSASPEDAARFQPDIELRMMTTCLTLGRPYVFPFATKAFHWCPDCWRAYFPPGWSITCWPTRPRRPRRPRPSTAPRCRSTSTARTTGPCRVRAGCRPCRTFRW